MLRCVGTSKLPRTVFREGVLAAMATARQVAGTHT